MEKIVRVDVEVGIFGVRYFLGFNLGKLVYGGVLRVRGVGAVSFSALLEV